MARVQNFGCFDLNCFSWEFGTSPFVEQNAPSAFMYFERIPRFWTTTMTGGWPLPRRPRRPGQNYNSIHHHHHRRHHHHHHDNNNNNNVQLNTCLQILHEIKISESDIQNHALDTWVLRHLVSNETLQMLQQTDVPFFQTPRYDPRKKSGRITRKPLENQDSLGRYLVDWNNFPFCIQQKRPWETPKICWKSDTIS